jgi:hypothetical protein
VTDRQRLVAVDAAGECQDSLHGALVLPHVEPRAVDRSRPGHGPSLPRLAHADGFPFSRSAHRRSVRAACGSAAGAPARADYDGGATRRSSHAVARRARAALSASPRPSRRLARVAPAGKFESFEVAGARAHVPGVAAPRAKSRPGSQVGREGVAPSSTSCRIAREARRGWVVSGRCSATRTVRAGRRGGTDECAASSVLPFRTNP